MVQRAITSSSKIFTGNRVERKVEKDIKRLLKHNRLLGGSISSTESTEKHLQEFKKTPHKNSSWKVIDLTSLADDLQSYKVLTEQRGACYSPHRASYE